MTTTTSAYSIWRSGKIVPARIAMARLRGDLPQQCVANVCGTDIETVDLWEQGVEYPSWDEAEDFLAITEVTMEFLARPMRGPGGLFAVPDSWAEEEQQELMVLPDEFCDPAIESAVYGWPTSMEELKHEAFG